VYAHQLRPRRDRPPNFGGLLTRTLEEVACAGTHAFARPRQWRNNRPFEDVDPLRNRTPPRGTAISPPRVLAIAVRSAVMSGPRTDLMSPRWGYPPPTVLPGGARRSFGCMPSASRRSRRGTRAALAPPETALAQGRAIGERALTCPEQLALQLAPRASADRAIDRDKRPWSATALVNRRGRPSSCRHRS